MTGLCVVLFGFLVVVVAVLVMGGRALLRLRSEVAVERELRRGLTSALYALTAKQEEDAAALLVSLLHTARAAPDAHLRGQAQSAAAALLARATAARVSGPAAVPRA